MKKMNSNPGTTIKRFTILYESYDEVNGILRDLVEAAYSSELAADWSMNERVGVFCFYCCLSDLLRALFSIECLPENQKTN